MLLDELKPSLALASDHSHNQPGVMCPASSSPTGIPSRGLTATVASVRDR